MQRKFSKKHLRNHPKVNSAVAAWRNEANSPSDVLGWYTGVPSKDAETEPEQDQDDL